MEINQKEIYEAYFGRNVEYYTERLEDYHNGQKTSFSFKAFFLGLFWMTYRKMYGHLFAIMAIILVEGIIVELLYQFDIINEGVYNIENMISILLLSGLFGMFANKFYLEKSIKNVETIMAQYNDRETMLEAAKKKGGVNWVAPFVLLAILLFLNFVAA